MSKFSGQKRHRGKRRNRQNTEGLNHDQHVTSAIPKNDPVEGSSDTRADNDVFIAETSFEVPGRRGATDQVDRSTIRTSRNGYGKSGASSGTPIGASPENIGQTNSPRPQGDSERATASVGHESDRLRKSARRRTRRDRGPQSFGSGPRPASGDADRGNSNGTSQTASDQKTQQGEPGKQADGKTQLIEGQIAGASSRKRRNTRRRGAKPKQGNEAILRNMRSPVTPPPRVAFVPRAEDENSGVDGQPQNAKGNAARPSAFARPRENALYAALDLGTNNCRLLIATPQERGRFRVVDGFSKIVRLGEGLTHSGKLSDAAMDRAVEALKICSEKLMSHTVRGYRLIATEACRQAENGAHFLARVKSETGMDLEIIDRETEAYLAAEGCGALMDKKADAAVLFDIGGGSSELVLVNRQGRKKRIADQIVSWHSLPIGVVTLAERHGGAEVNKDSFQRMVDEVREHLSKFDGKDALLRIWKNGKVHLLGTSGTVTTLAGIHLGLPRYERRLVDGLWLASSDIDRVIRDLLAMDYKQRAASPCIGTERADLVMAGCAILEGIRQVWPSERLRVADRGLREGMLTQLMERDLAWLPPKHGRKRRNKYWKQSRTGPSGQVDTRNGKT